MTYLAASMRPSARCRMRSARHFSAVLVAFGIWTSDQAAVVAGVVTAILPNILAFFNTDPGMYEDPSGDTSAEPGGSAESGE